MSKELREFLTDYLDWVQNGAPDFKPFRRHLGLCGNVLRVYDEYPGAEVVAELNSLFEVQGMDYPYPFGSYDYGVRCYDRTQHKNEARINWVRKQLETNGV